MDLPHCSLTSYYDYYGTLGRKVKYKKLGMAVDDNKATGITSNT